MSTERKGYKMCFATKIRFAGVTTQFRSKRVI